MKELSLNILDLAVNSINAKAGLIEITIEETDDKLLLNINDNGAGMTQETLSKVTDPFYTTRTTRKVGLGLPFFKQAALQTGGYMEITSKTEHDFPQDHGTRVSALFYKNHMDFTPLGDIISTITTLISGSPDIRIIFTHKAPALSVKLDTDEIKEALGSGISVAEPEVLDFIRKWLEGQYGLPEA